MFERGRRVRRIARAMIALAIGWGLGVLFLWVAQPGFMGGGWYAPWYVSVLPIVGIVSYVVGLGWMVRIYRPSLEPGERAWRYRDY